MDRPVDCVGLACADNRCDFKPMRFQRRPVGDHDVLFDVKYCGVCHTDVAWAKGETGALLPPPVYPVMPGHEVVGVCTAVGKSVTKFKVGDHVGVGCVVDSCLACSQCGADAEEVCEKRYTNTYGDTDRHGRAGTYPEGSTTKGGYSTKYVIHESFGVLIPPTYPMEAAGPLMCAGITVYKPMKMYHVRKGMRVGIVGLGGLGLTAIKIAKALGAHVTAISRGEAKRQIALDAGADAYIATSIDEQLRSSVSSMHLIINTIPSNHDYNIYVPLLDDTGKMVILGLNSALPASYLCEKILNGRCAIGFSVMGGILATQEVVNLADKHNILPTTEIIPVTELNSVFELQDAGNDAGLRYVLDIGGSLSEENVDVVSCGKAPKLNPHASGLTTWGIVSEFASMFYKQVIWGRRAALPNQQSQECE